jgi:adenylate cyclase
MPAFLPVICRCGGAFIEIKCVLTSSRSASQGHNLPNPGSSNNLYSSTFSWNSPDISPRDERKGLGSHRKVLATLGTDDPGPPPTSSSSSKLSQMNPNQIDYFHQNPYNPVPSWSTSPKIAPIDSSGTFFHDFSEHEASPSSATFRPGTGRTFASEPVDSDYNGDHRRPSVASATTISSQGSKSSTGGRFRKKLQGFFGDEYSESKQEPEQDTRSLSSRPGSIDQFKARERANSDGARNLPERSQDETSSRHASRPRTPLPSSEITPWLYQSFNVSALPKFCYPDSNPSPQLVCVCFEGLEFLIL